MEQVMSNGGTQPILAALAAHPIPALDLSQREVYIANMQFLHGVIRASEPLLREVLNRDMNRRLWAFYREHLAEETGHAAWLTEDLRAMNAEVPEIHWAAAQVAGLQYYLVRHGPPELLLGYMAALECRPMPMEAVAALEAIHGVPAVRTLRHHAEHDIEHGAELLRAIAEAQHQEEIVMNATLTAAMLAESLKRIQ